MPTEVTFDGLHLAVSKSQELDIPERLTITGLAEVFHECLVIMSEELLDLEVINEVNLRFPTFLLESTLTDVIVTSRARKGEVLGQ